MKIVESLKRSVNEANNRKALELYKEILKLTKMSPGDIEEVAEENIDYLWEYAKFDPDIDKNLDKYMPRPKEVKPGGSNPYTRWFENIILNGLFFDIKDLEAAARYLKTMPEEERDGHYLVLEVVKNTEVVLEDEYAIGNGAHDPQDYDEEYFKIVSQQVRATLEA